MGFSCCTWRRDQHFASNNLPLPSLYQYYYYIYYIYLPCPVIRLISFYAWNNQEPRSVACVRNAMEDARCVIRMSDQQSKWGFVTSVLLARISIGVWSVGVKECLQLTIVLNVSGPRRTAMGVHESPRWGRRGWTITTRKESSNQPMLLLPFKIT